MYKRQIHFLTESGAKTTAENISRAYVNCPDDYFSVLEEVKKSCKKLADDEILILSGDEYRITSETQQRIFEMMNNIDIANYRIKGEITKQVKQMSLVRGAQNLTVDSVNVGFAVQSDSGEPLSTGGDQGMKVVFHDILSVKPSFNEYVEHVKEETQSQKGIISIVPSSEDVYKRQVRVQPCCICVGEDILRCRATDAGDPYFVRVLRTVHLLDEQFVASGDKLHTGNVVVSRIAGNLYPGCRSPGCRKIAHFDCRVRAACLRIREMQDGRVDGIHIIDDVEHPRSFCVALPVGDILSVRTPSETVAAGEFFFIHPVECTVHDRLAPVMGPVSYPHLDVYKRQG